MLAAAGAGCAKPKPVISTTVPNTVLGRAAVAVAPAINLSGSQDFDPNRFADLMAVELAYADGISVIPVSRVLGVLAVQGKDRIESPQHASEVIEWLGSDALLVFAVTEYVPYDPPRIGISTQLFVADRDPKMAGQTADEGGIEGDDQRQGQRAIVLAESQRVFDASHERVIADIQAFALGRAADDSPYGWRKYVVSQEGFIQFCCHASIAALLNRGRMTPAEAGPQGR